MHLQLLPLSIFVTLIALASGCASHPAKAPASAPVTFTNTTAIVRGVRADAHKNSAGQKEIVVVGTKFSAGDTISTGPDSSVDLFLADNGPVIRVTEKSVLTFRELSRGTTGEETVVRTSLFLAQGRILGTVKKLSERSVYDVQTPVSTAHIRGGYDLDSTGRLSMTSGAATCRYGSQLTRISEGQTFQPATEVQIKRKF